jgi:hypothetical protein
MRKVLLGFAGLAVALVAPLSAHAACVAPISWGVTYATETSYASNLSAVGSQLTIRGLIDCFNAPFADLDPTTKQYTVVIQGLVSNGTVVTPLGGGFTEFKTVYSGAGTFAYYEDTTTPADPANPPTYSDGTPILTGVLTQLTVDFTLGPTGSFVSGNFDTGPMGSGAAFTGGTLFSRVSNFGQGCPLRDTGGWNVSPNAHPAGYTAEVAGKTDIDCNPTAAQSQTWGRSKAMYR